MAKMKNVTYAQAILEAIDEEMARDENVLLMGEDVGILGGNFKTAVGLFEKYGDLRVKDTPLSENSFFGMSLGMAITGLRPIVELMFSDFLFLAGDQLLNQIAKIRYMSGGQVKVPLTVRTTIGAGRSSAAQHSQSLHAILCHVPGLKVVVPSSGAEAKGLLKTAIRDDNPVVFVEHKMEYNQKYDIPEGEYTIPFGKANVVREGKDITVIATSNLVLKAAQAAEELAKEGIDVEIIDPRTLIPFDRETFVTSVKKTGRIFLADEGYERSNIVAEIVMNLMPDIFYYLDAPPERLCLPNVPLPFSPALEFPLIPDQDKITKRIRKILKG
jgi:acetoin:2,6-dichlorophenolindophenol oxidoreductase subunit beta